MSTGLGNFDATQFAPKQGGVAHPIGIFDFVISDTKIVATGVDKDNPNGTGLTFAVDFTSPAGTITNRYNLWNNSAQTVEIAHGQLSALCHVTGVMRLQMDGCPREMAGATLRNARGKMEIVQQIDKDTKQPTQFVRLARVMDVNGNEPGKAPAGAQTSGFAQQQPASQPQQNGFNPPAGNPPMQQTPAGGWGQPNQQPVQQQPQQNWQQPAQQANPAQQNGGWQQPASQPQQGQPQQAQPQQWQPGGNAGGPAPWTNGPR